MRGPACSVHRSGALGPRPPFSVLPSVEERQVGPAPTGPSPKHRIGALGEAETLFHCCLWPLPASFSGNAFRLTRMPTFTVSPSPLLPTWYWLHSGQPSRCPANKPGPPAQLKPAPPPGSLPPSLWCQNPFARVPHHLHPNRVCLPLRCSNLGRSAGFELCSLCVRRAGTGARERERQA